MNRILKPLAIAATLIATLAPAKAYAGDHAAFECAGFRAVPPEAIDHDPVVKTSIELYAPLRAKDWTMFEVIHTTLKGETFSREKQYRDIRRWSTNKGDFWSGVSIKDWRRTMVGQLTYDNSRENSTISYIEKSYISGRLERTVMTTCVAN